MTTTTLPTRNEAWGFWGTTARSESAAAIEPATAWEAAFRAIAAATGGSPEGVRDFLDGRHGRHFADDVATAIWDGEAPVAAIEGAVNRWMDWTIDQKSSRDWGIPRGLPYLTGFVTHFALMAELD